VDHCPAGYPPAKSTSAKKYPVQTTNPQPKIASDVAKKMRAKGKKIQPWLQKNRQPKQKNIGGASKKLRAKKNATCIAQPMLTVNLYCKTYCAGYVDNATGVARYVLTYIYWRRA